MFFKHLSFFTIFCFSAYYFGCSSGEYDLDETTIEYVEKIPVIDTTKVALDDENNPKEAFYTIQIGAFYNPDNFERFKEMARTIIGKELYHVYINDLYKIRFGRFDIKSEAEKYLSYAKSLGYWDAFIIPTKK